MRRMFPARNPIRRLIGYVPCLEGQDFVVSFQSNDKSKKIKGGAAFSFLFSLFSFLFFFPFGCAYRYAVGPLVPLGEETQGPRMSVADDGTVAYTYERLEISVRPMTDAELNRQFANASRGGMESTNPYTYGDWIPRGEKITPSRFTVFLLTVKNYTFPKIVVDPSKVLITTQNGRVYSPLSLQYLKEYYVSFVIGYAGNATQRYEERKDILLRTLFPRDEPLFSGQSQRGYIVFPVLHEDVREITIELRDIILRFDSWGKPVEKLNVAYHFRREVEVVRPGSQKVSVD